MWVDNSHSEGTPKRPRPPRSDSDKDDNIRSDEDFWEEIEPRMNLQAMVFDFTRKNTTIQNMPGLNKTFGGKKGDVNSPIKKAKT